MAGRVCGKPVIPGGRHHARLRRAKHEIAGLHRLGRTVLLPFNAPEPERDRSTLSENDLGACRLKENLVNTTAVISRFALLLVTRLLVASLGPVLIVVFVLAG